MGKGEDGVEVNGLCLLPGPQGSWVNALLHTALTSLALAVRHSAGIVVKASAGYITCTCTTLKRYVLLLSDVRGLQDPAQHTAMSRAT